MWKSHISYSVFFILFSSIFATSIFATTEARCTMSDTSASPIQKWKENIDILNTAIRKRADEFSCENGDTNGSAGLMREMYSQSSTGADFLPESDAFLDPSGPIQELKPHRTSIEDIEKSLLETAQYVWAHCAQWSKMTTNVLEWKARYNTQRRTLTEIMVDMTKQTKEVKRFFYVLSQWVQTEEYIDEVPFLIATPGFSKDMYVYFSPKHLQECRDNDPRKKAILDVMKEAFTSGWKYPQAMQVWKDAMALLLYRWSQLTGLGSQNTDKDNQINSIVQARKGGIGNSDILINSQFFKELWYRPNSKTVGEKVATQEHKALYETIGYEFMRKVIPNLASQSDVNNTALIKNIQTQEETQKIQEIQDRTEALYAQYRNRLWNIEQGKANDPLPGSELVKNIEAEKQIRKNAETAEKNICNITGKQAVTVPGATRC